MNEIDICIRNLYHSASLGMKGYRRRALAQLSQVIDFDGALWGTGHLTSNSFHSVDVLGVNEDYPTELAKYKHINPLYEALKREPSKALNLSDVMNDEILHCSDIYIKFFAVKGIERILGILLEDESTGIVSVISLYRFDKERHFQSKDKENLQKLAYHLVNSASHAYFLHLQHQPSKHEALAICDSHGLFFEVQPTFIQLLKTHFPDIALGKLPFELSQKQGTLAQEHLCYELHELGDLYCVALWEKSPFDLLSPREKEVVNAITKGFTFKEAAREIGIAPSTVSNHLYKIYGKLNVSSRSELAQLAKHS